MILRSIIVLAFIMLCVPAYSAESYFTRPIHEDDFGLAKIKLKMQKELDETLKDAPDAKMIVMNYFKTVEFTDGVVSVAQQDYYDAALNALPVEVRARVVKLLSDRLDEKKLHISVTDLKRRERNLQIEIPE